MSFETKQAVSNSLRGLLSPILYDPLHVVQYRMPFGKRSHLDASTVIFSVDVDVGNEQVGQVNHGKNDANVSDTMSEKQVGLIEQIALPLILDVLDSFDIPVTFAMRGQLFDVSPETVESVTERSLRHDVGGHGYFHRSIGTLTAHEAYLEFKMLDDAMRRNGLEPESFVFPRESISYLGILASFGYSCFRARGGFPRNRMFADNAQGLWRLYPTLFINDATKPNLVNKIIDICASKASPAHFWFHPSDFGHQRIDVESALAIVLKPILAHISKLRLEGKMMVNTMKDFSEHCQRNQIVS